MSNSIERGAKALFEAWRECPEGQLACGSKSREWDDLPELMQDLFRDEMRAVLSFLVRAVPK